MTVIMVVAIQLMAVCMCILWYSSLNKTASFIGWDAQTQTAVWPYVDQIAINTYLSLPASLKLSFLHFEIGSVQDTGITTPLDEVSFEECRIKGSIYASYSVPRATYSFVNCSWLPSLSLSNFSRNTLDVRGANLIVESSQLTDVDLYYFYRGSSLVNRPTLVFIHEELEILFSISWLASFSFYVVASRTGIFEVLTS